MCLRDGLPLAQERSELVLRSGDAIFFRGGELYHGIDRIVPDTAPPFWYKHAHKFREATANTLASSEETASPSTSAPTNASQDKYDRKILDSVPATRSIDRLNIQFRDCQADAAAGRYRPQFLFVNQQVWGSEVRKRCMYCCQDLHDIQRGDDKSNALTNKCNQCLYAEYCSEACMLADGPFHKLHFCKNLAANSLQALKAEEDDELHGRNERIHRVKPEQK